MDDKRTPLLLVGDAVDSKTGLGRITRDLAVRIHEHLSDVYRFATLGYAGSGSREFGFQQYHIEGMASDWVIPNLSEVWEDFAGEQRGIIMFVWDCSRLEWFSQPHASEKLKHHPALKQWLQENISRFEKWIYCPIDASGPNDALTYPLHQSLLGFDLILAYTQFGEDIIRRTIGESSALSRGLTYLPHGIDSTIFFPLNRTSCRKLFLKYTGAVSIPVIVGRDKVCAPITDKDTLVGIVATNQSRKDWALAIEAASILNRRHRVRLWIHIDEMERYWSIPSLLIDYGLIENAVISTGFIPDEKMAQAYSACDVTIGPGPEGFGYPIMESMFCGTPCVTGNYGGAPEFMHMDGMLPEPIAYRYEGIYAQKRPVYSPQDFSDKIESVIGRRMNRPGEIDWHGDLWKHWEGWFRRGLK